MQCHVQNLHGGGAPGRYKLVFFGNDDEGALCALAGDVPVSENGEGISGFRFRPVDFDGKGHELLAFPKVVVAEVADGEGVGAAEAGQGLMRAVLVGALAEEDGKSGGEAALYASREKRMARESGLTSGNGATPESGLAFGNGAAQESNLASGSEAVLKSGVASVNGATLRGGAPQEAADGKTSDSDPEASTPLALEQRATFNRYYNEWLLHFCRHFCSLSGYYRDVEPFEEDGTGAQWKRMGNVSNLPLISPGAHYLAALRHHYLFGERPANDGVEHMYFFAVPGRNLAEEQPDGGRSGFVLWQASAEEGGSAVDSGRRQSDREVYWIAAIDGETGDIVAP